jgi:hypothetical protein
MRSAKICFLGVRGGGKRRKESERIRKEKWGRSSEQVKDTVGVCCPRSTVGGSGGWYTQVFVSHVENTVCDPLLLWLLRRTRQNCLSLLA